MDLSTTKKIQRRVLRIDADPNEELTNCTITVANWFQNQNLENVKFKISSFYLENTSIACFIPKYIYAIPDSSIFKDKNPAETVNIFSGATLNSNSLDYWVAIRHNATTTTTVSYIEMNQIYSEYPNLQPSVHPVSPSNQYKNRYYWFFNTSKFAELITAHLSTLIDAIIPVGAPHQVEAVRTTVNGSASYGLYLQDGILNIAGYDIMFSPSLINLFQFKSVESIQSTQLRTIIFNTQQRTYNSILSHFVASNYVGTQWFPYDEIAFRSDLPIQTVGYYDTSNYIKQSYQNIILSYFCITAVMSLCDFGNISVLLLLVIFLYDFQLR